MSHFSVMVIGPKNQDELAAALAPFQENNMGDCPKQFLEFVEDEDSDMDEETGKNGYWENPNAKWDWYQLGGRWAGFLLLKTADKGRTVQAGRGTQSLLDKSDPYEGNPLRADYARLGDIDWEGMHKADIESAGRAWDAEMARIAKADKPEAVWRAEFDGMDQETGQRFSGMCEHTGLPATWETYRLWSLNMPFSGVNLLRHKTREDYVAQVSVPTTFAFLKDGKWGERGGMGWFGMVRDEKDCGTWEQEFEQMLEALPEDTMVWIVDCHI